MSDRIAIVGASVRAAAASAVRAGFEVVAADLFADTDLCGIADSTQIEDYPNGFARWLESLSPMPAAWLYTGALENHPDLIDQLTAISPLWGNTGDVLRQVRSVSLLSETFQGAGLRFPETRHTSLGLPQDGTWLVKTGRGASGSGVAAWRGQNIDGSAFLQQRLPGVPCSATYVATGGKSHLLGVARQLIGESWLRAREYQFSGAIAPWVVSESARDEIQVIGDLLASRFYLHGVFGVDMMIEDEQVWTIEVNPRYPSSAEVIERASGASVLAAHAESCRSTSLISGFSTSRGLVFGKAILFARRAIEVTKPLQLPAHVIDSSAQFAMLADIPRAGTRIHSAHPIVTIFAHGASADEVAACLKARVALVEEQLYA